MNQSIQQSPLPPPKFQSHEAMAPIHQILYADDTTYLCTYLLHGQVFLEKLTGFQLHDTT